MLLSREDLRRIEQSATEYEELIARFLNLVFMSILWCPKDVRVREAIGLRMARRYLQKYGAPGGRSQLLAALWEDGLIFSSADLRIMNLLTPHLDRAVRLGGRLNFGNVQARLMSGVLDHLALGVVLLDGANLPIWLNRRAEELSRTTGAFLIAPVGLVGRNPAASRAIRGLIGRARETGEPAVAALDGGERSKSLVLITVPLDPHEAAVTGNEGAHSVVFVSDPDSSDHITALSLQHAFDLTRREAQVAMTVARGGGLKLAACALGVAPTTARSHLQQVFAKTGTSHQAELTALIHRTLAQLRLGGPGGAYRPDPSAKPAAGRSRA
jgi:DNA-binding CsgD family transcriptional regulator